MCGIFGYVGSGDAASLVMRGLRKLEYRGYDSWGVAVARDGRVAVERRVGVLGDAESRLSGGPALGHTRWATHGGVTERNAHPHVDCAGRLAVVHNGIVVNHRELRDALAGAGHRFRSETDTEVFAHMLEDALACTPDGPGQLVHATMAAFRELRGLNAIAVLDGATGQLAAAKSGSPLVIGWSDDGDVLASDASAVLEHTRRVTYVDEGQAVLVTREGSRLFDVASGREIAPEITEIGWEAADAELGVHPDYMTKEIHEQPAVLRRVADGAAEDVRALAAMLRDASDVVAVGCGTAGHAALAARYLLARLAGRAVAVVPGSEFAYLGELVRPGSLVVALSQSGETIDVIEAARLAKARGARVAALVNVEGSTLWRLADRAVPLGAGPERCVLSTKSFLAKLAVLLMTAHELGGQPHEGARQVRAAADEVARMLSGDRREHAPSRRATISSSSGEAPAIRWRSR
jgi:glucosamine--fructose-6-phosphate aminotransferase (isomerizing)